MNLTLPGWAPSVHHFDEIYAIFPVSSSLRGLQGGFVFKCNLFTLSHVTRETSTNWGRNIAFAGESLYKHNVYTNRKNLDL